MRPVIEPADSVVLVADDVLEDPYLFGDITIHCNFAAHLLVDKQLLRLRAVSVVKVSLLKQVATTETSLTNLLNPYEPMLLSTIGRFCPSRCLRNGWSTIWIEICVEFRSYG